MSGGKQYTASAKKEVIISAGSVQTPQLLELSGESLCPSHVKFFFSLRYDMLGIGNRRILESYGLSTLVDLPGVGENLQVSISVYPMRLLTCI